VLCIDPSGKAGLFVLRIRDGIEQHLCQKSGQGKQAVWAVAKTLLEWQGDPVFNRCRFAATATECNSGSALQNPGAQENSSNFLSNEKKSRHNQTGLVRSRDGFDFVCTHIRGKNIF
jgi:hypothetical protein